MVISFLSARRALFVRNNLSFGRYRRLVASEGPKAADGPHINHYEAYLSKNQFHKREQLCTER